MGRGPIEIHSDATVIEQKPAISDNPDDYEGDIVLAQQIIDKNYAEELAFNEEPVTIRIEPSSERNASQHFPVWVNGQPAQVFQRGRWEEVGYLPVSRVLTVKRKVVEVLIRAKVDRIVTETADREEIPNRPIQRFTSAVHSFSVLEDRNPRGAAWMTELRRRNF